MLRVLIAIDGSEQSERAFNFYLEELHRPENVVHVLQCPEELHVSHALFSLDRHKVLYTEEDVGMTFEEFQQIVGTERSQWSVLKERLMAVLEKHHVHVGGYEIIPAFNKQPGEIIVSRSRDMHIDLVVMGSRGLGYLGRSFSGSVSDYVLHHVHVPVFIHRA